VCDVALDKSLEVLGYLVGVVAIAPGQLKLDSFDARAGFDPALGGVGEGNDSSQELINIPCRIARFGLGKSGRPSGRQARANRPSVANPATNKPSEREQEEQPELPPPHPNRQLVRHPRTDQVVGACLRPAK